jgi:hypothetical protein
MVRRIARILLTLAALAAGGFVVLVLIGLWDRYEQNIAALNFMHGIYKNRKVDARTPLEAEPSQQARPLQQPRKLVGAGAVENANYGMSASVSADGQP